MIFRLRLILMVGVISLLFSHVVFANNATFINHSFDFKKPLSIYIDPYVHYGEKAHVDYASQMEISKIIGENQKKLKKFKIAPNAASADLIISTDMLEWDTRQYYVPGHSYVTYKERVDYKTKDGKKAYTEIPYKKDEPGRYAHCNFLTVRYTVCDKNYNTVYIYMDNRDAYKDHINMFERATKNFFTNFNKIKK